jgi:prophage antirepressor-like protein
MGVVDEYYLVFDQRTWPEVNLTEEGKCKFTAEGAHLPCPIWFVSETGFWKIVAKSNSSWPARFRASFLPTVFEGGL